MMSSATRGIRMYMVTAVLTLVVPATWGATLTVPGDYLTIQAAINAAFDDDVVEIADGTYTGEGNKNLDFAGKAITVRSASGDPALCLIDCEEDGRGFLFQNGEGPDSTVEGLTITNGRTDEFGIGGGVKCVFSNPTFLNCVFHNGTAHMGGGVSCENSNSTFTDCVFSENIARFDAGIRCDSSNPVFTNCVIRGNADGGVGCVSSNPTFNNCEFLGNTGGFVEAALRVLRGDAVLTNCVFEGNSGIDGGAAFFYRSNSTLTNCVIQDNSAFYTGGGIYCRAGCSLLIRNCTIRRNQAEEGGAIYCENSSPTVVFSRIYGNLADHGGAVYCVENGNPRFNHCTISGNYAHAGGGGFDCEDSSPLFSNCTITGNTAGYGGGAFYINRESSTLTLTNCILWGDTRVFAGPVPSEILCVAGSTAIATYSNIEDGWPGEGNIDADPLFVREPDPGLDGEWGTEDDDPGDLRLQATSPCIDAGSNTHPPYDGWDLDEDGCTTEPLPVDLDGNARYWDDPNTPDTGQGTAPIVDMGVYEFGATTEIPWHPCSADCNCDGSADFDDIDPMVAALSGEAGYQNQYPDCIWMNADCNNDGIVNFDDIDPFVALLGH